MTTFARNLVALLRDFIYPPLCFVCQRRMDNADARVCAECWSSFPPFRGSDAVGLELHHRFMENGAIADFLSCYYFEKEGRLQEVIHLLKYGGVRSMGVMLGRDVGRLMLQRREYSEADCIVPVPLHKLKQRERGFNQSEMICVGISEVTGIPVNAKLIARTKYTASQTKLTLRERAMNVNDAFAIVPHRQDCVKEKKIILVDDVITTGSTIGACATVLVKAGAKVVLAASTAVAQR